MRTLGLATTLALLAWPGRAHAEYGWANHNGVLAGLGSPIDYALAKDPDDKLGLDTEFTIEAWVYPLESGHEMTVVSKGMPNWEVRLDETLQVKFYNTCASVTLGPKLPAKRWTHIALVSRAIADEAHLDLYVDGLWVDADEVPSLPPEQCPHPPGLPVTLGASLSEEKAYFEGMIDEVRVWNPARDQPQIARDRFVGLGDAPGADWGSAITAALEYQGLMASWTFNGDGTLQEYIGGFSGSYEGNAQPLEQLATAIPYNLALRLPGGPGDYVVAPDDPGTFNQVHGGTLDLWVRPASLTRTALVSRGTGLRLGTDADGAVTFKLGAVTIATPDATLAIGRWTHVAATWLQHVEDNHYTLAIYVDGQLAAVDGDAATTFPTTPHDLWIGQFPGNPIRPFDGYLDEVRWWHGAADVNVVRRRMFSSARNHGADGDTPLAAWAFEGNLVSHVDAARNATFVNGLANGARFSGYDNEDVGGAFGPFFHAHPTVLNRTRTPAPNLFAAAFKLRAPALAVPTGGSASDTITIPTPAPTTTRVEFMLSLRTPWVALASCEVLHAGHHYLLFPYAASDASDVLSFFADDLPGTTTDDATYPAPWGFTQAAASLAVPMSAAGDWTLTCSTTIASSGAVIRGWGLRLIP